MQGGRAEQDLPAIDHPVVGAAGLVHALAELDPIVEERLAQGLMVLGQKGIGGDHWPHSLTPNQTSSVIWV
ncbi:hypothetical protein D3C86_265310 [compost metagenome]